MPRRRWTTRRTTTSCTSEGARPRMDASVRRRRNWDPGLLAVRYLGIVGLRAGAVVPVPFRMSHRRPFDVDRRFFYDDRSRDVVRRRRIVPIWVGRSPPPRSDAHDDTATVDVMSTVLPAAMAAPSFTGRYLKQKQEERRQDDEDPDPSHQHHSGQPLRPTLPPTRCRVNDVLAFVGAATGRAPRARMSPCDGSAAYRLRARIPRRRRSAGGRLSGVGSYM